MLLVRCRTVDRTRAPSGENGRKANLNRASRASCTGLACCWSPLASTQSVVSPRPAVVRGRYTFSEKSLVNKGKDSKGYIKIASSKNCPEPPFSLYPLPPPGAAIWYSTPVINLLICSDPLPRTLVWLPDTPRGAWKPLWPRGGRRRGGCSLRGRPGLLREERDFGSGRVQIDVPLLEGAALVLYSFPRAGTTHFESPDSDSRLSSQSLRPMSTPGRGLRLATRTRVSRVSIETHWSGSGGVTSDVSGENLCRVR